MLSDGEIRNLILLLKKTGDEVLKIYNSSFETSIKGDFSPITSADIKSNEIIKLFLENNYPGYGILSEESAEDENIVNKEFCFIVDPIDGTKEFVNKSDEFTINIGLAKNNKIVYGFVFAPALNRLYYGGERLGSFLLNTKNNELRKINVSDRVDNLIMVSSKNHKTEKETQLFNDNKDRILEEKLFGSSLKGCNVASGTADIYYRFGPTNEWDIAAMHGIIEGAGGIIKEMDGEEITYNRGKNNHLNKKGFFVVNRPENIFKICTKNEK